MSEYFSGSYVFLLVALLTDPLFHVCSAPTTITSALSPSLISLARYAYRL